MIRVTIEKISYGFGKPETLAVLKIWNEGLAEITGSSSYGYSFHEKDQRDVIMSNKFPHIRKRHYLKLVVGILKEVLNEIQRQGRL